MTRFYDAGHGKVLQFERLLVDEANMTAEEMEAVLREPKLAHGMLGWLREQLNPPVPQPSYTPVADYVDRIMARSELRGWGLTANHADGLWQQLEGINHAGPLSPVGVRIWLGKTLEHNWAETLAWLEDTAKEQGLEYYKYFDSVPEFRPGSEIKGKASLRAVGLDLSLWNPQGGIVPNDEFPNLPSWPSLEVPQLLCLNPELMHAMDGENFPFLMSSGLVVEGFSVPSFDRDGQKLSVGYGWPVNRWHFRAMVRPRELQS